MLLHLCVPDPLLAVGQKDGTLRVVSVRNWPSHIPLWRVRCAHRGPVTALAGSSDHILLASGGTDGAVHVWRTCTGTCWYSFATGVSVTDLRWSAHGMLTCHCSRQVISWTVPELVDVA